MKWRIKEIFSPKYNKTLYIPQQKGLFFYSSFTYQEYCEYAEGMPFYSNFTYQEHREYVERLHNMASEFELVWEFPDNRVGFKTAGYAKRMIEYYCEYLRIRAKHEEVEKEARKKGKKFKTKYIEVD